jgi:prephenate dehydratase
MSAAGGAANLARYGYLGPAGTFCEAALLSVVDADESHLEPYSTVTMALEGLRAGAVDYAMVPLENSVEGSVAAAVDGLAIGEPLVIVREVHLPVSFCLAARPGTALADVRTVTAHPHAEAQCRAWLGRTLPEAVVVPSASNASAALDVAGEAPHADAAVTSRFAAEVYGLEPLADGIGSNAEAETRFVLVTRPVGPPPPTGSDKTTLALFISDDHPGALLEILTEFAMRGINLTRLESRPTGGGLGSYFFSVDAEGHLSDERMGEALLGLRRVCTEVRYLGSYPRVDGVRPVLRRGVTDAEYADSRGWLDDLRSL